MLVRLTAKLAEVVDGLDISHCVEGDVLELSDRDGAMLIAEGWAETVSEDEVPSCHPKHVEREIAADEGYRGWRRARTAPRGPEHRFQTIRPPGPFNEPEETE
jgi:hypothetical protein